MKDMEAWEPRKIIIDGEEIEVPERCEVRIVADDGGDLAPEDIEGAQRCGWLMEAISRGFEGSDKRSFLNSVPDEYREEAANFFDIARWDWGQQVA